MEKLSAAALQSCHAAGIRARNSYSSLELAKGFEPLTL